MEELMKRGIYHPDPTCLLRLSVYAFLCTALLSGCGRDVVPENTFSVMTYNLHQYVTDDLDSENWSGTLPPESARRAAIELILKEAPDVLAVQEMGAAATFTQFREALRTGGLNYAYSDLLERNGANLAVLSRFPIVAVQHRTNDFYSIGKAQVRVARGFLDVEVQVNPNYRFRMLVAHLKSKVYHPLGQTEMRRNEARLLNKAVRDILEENPEINLLVVGDLNDDYNSAPLREVGGRRGGGMTDLRPLDSVGDVWTCFQASADCFSRFDYFFVSKGMLPEVMREQTRVVRDPLTYEASDHRPVVSVFLATDQ